MFLGDSDSLKHELKQKNRVLLENHRVLWISAIAWFEYYIKQGYEQEEIPSTKDNHKPYYVYTYEYKE